MIDVQTDERGSIRVAGSANVAHAAQLHAALQGAAQALATVPSALDLAGLTALDVAGMQVLIAFKRSVPSLRVHSCPPSLRLTLDRCGLLPFLL